MGVELGAVYDRTGYVYVWQLENDFVLLEKARLAVKEELCRRYCEEGGREPVIMLLLLDIVSLSCMYVYVDEN